MRPPPPLSSVGSYPVTAGTAILAIGVTLAWMGHYSMNSLIMTTLTFPSQPWRLITTIFPHVDIFHLLFNVYWLWVFGTLLERQFGPLRLCGLIVLLAAGSGAAEFAILNSGVGLSGVGYGLFGILWVLSRFDPRFSGAVDARTITLFVVWFFACIVMTVLNIMQIANIAHGMGAILGIMAGWAIVTHGSRRKLAIAAMCSLFCLIALASTVVRPWINFSTSPGIELSYAGALALSAQREDEGVAYLRQAIRYRYVPADAWYNLGTTYWRLDKFQEALSCLNRAVEISPTPEFRQTRDDLAHYLTELATEATRPAATTSPATASRFATTAP